jgi:hypothetical protein
MNNLHPQKELAQKGLALPTALLLLLVISIAGSLFTKASIRSLSITRQDEAITDSYHIAEGAIHVQIGQMSAFPHLWREKIPLSTSPSGYTEYSQLDYGATNGIPTCSGSKCILNLYPTGGGLIKNYGPVGGDGDLVDSTKRVWNQLNGADLPDEDVQLNGQDGFVQVERLDESIPTGANLGAELTNNPLGGAAPRNIRFRLTGKTLRPMGTRTGESTVVVIAELPST